MALVLDTRFLIAHTFPPTYDDRDKIRVFIAKIRQEKLIIPAIAIVEYIKIAGKRIGQEAAKVRIRAWIEAGAQVAGLTEEMSFKAGILALKNPNIPLADVIIATIASSYNAQIVSDDPHFEMLGVKTLWYK